MIGLSPHKGVLMDKSKLSIQVSKILCASPIEIFDEESNTVMSTEAWELVSPRTSGEYEGTRTIGSANMVTAYNIVYTNSLSKDVEAIELFNEIISILVEDKLIRKSPSHVRKTFKVI